MPFVYSRTVRFSDTDAAGVVYFATVLSMCHEAFEASLIEAGIEVRSFFSATGEVITPIVHASVDFFKPMYCGDRILIHMVVAQLNESKFEIRYQIYFEANPSQLISQAVTQHVCIDPLTRKKKALPLTLLNLSLG